MSPLEIEFLHRHDCFRKGLGIMPYGTGFLFQAARARMSHLCGKEILWDAGEIWRRATSQGYSYLWLHIDGPQREAPMFDKAEALDAFERPPFNRNVDDSGYASMGFERAIKKRKKLRITPMAFEREAEIDLARLRQHLENEVFDLELIRLLEGTYDLACGAEWAKENGNSRWARCDGAFRSLEGCLLQLFEKVSDVEGIPLGVEELIFGVRSRVLRGLRMTTEWRALAA